MEMMIARPTAASAAATVITMNTNSCPPTSPKKPDSETSDKFTAFSINSMHRNIVMALRLIKTPTAPMVKSRAESPKYHDKGTIRVTPQSKTEIENCKLKIGRTLASLLHVLPAPSRRQLPLESRLMSLQTEADSR